jgi:hypothetical protein
MSCWKFPSACRRRSRSDRNLRRLRKKAKTRLLTRAAQKGPCVFAVVYGAATVRESVAQAFFRSLLGCVLKRDAAPELL